MPEPNPGQNLKVSNLISGKPVPVVETGGEKPKERLPDNRMGELLVRKYQLEDKIRDYRLVYTEEVEGSGGELDKLLTELVDVEEEIKKIDEDERAKIAELETRLKADGYNLDNLEEMPDEQLSALWNLNSSEMRNFEANGTGIQWFFNLLNGKISHIREQRKKDKAESEAKVVELRLKEQIKLAEVKAYDPEDKVGLDKLYTELKAIREEIRKITGKKEGARMLPEISKNENRVGKKPLAATVEEPAIDIDGVTKESPSPFAVRIEKKEEHPAFAKFKAELAYGGITLGDIDKLEDLNFEQLKRLAFWAEILVRDLKRDIDPQNSEMVKFLETEMPKIAELLEVKGVEENKRLAKEDYAKLRTELADMGISLKMWDLLDLAKLLGARDVLKAWLQKFPGNEELQRYLDGVGRQLRERYPEVGNQTIIARAPEELKNLKPKDEKGGLTPEEEKTLKTLLQTIERAKKRLAELDEMEARLPKTMK